jgi:hypothetical protein
MIDPDPRTRALAALVVLLVVAATLFGWAMLLKKVWP